MIWLLLFVVVIYFVLDLLYRRTNHYKNLFEDTLKLREYKNTPIDYINIGSTQARYAYDFGNIGLNVATNEQSLEYSFMLLKKYIKNLKKGGNVIITVADMDLLLTGGLQQRKYKYCGILPVKVKDLLKYKFFPLLFNIKAIKYILKDEKLYNKFDVSQNLLLNDSQKYNDCQRRIKRWESYGAVYSNDEKKFELKNNNVEDNIKILNNIIEFCHLHNYNVVVVTPPTSKYFNDFFGDSFKEVLNKPIEDFAYNNVKYFDYSSDESINNDENFLNTACLNQVGRTKFTDIVIKSLQ